MAKPQRRKKKKPASTPKPAAKATGTPGATLTLHQVFQHWGGLARKGDWAELRAQLAHTLDRLRALGRDELDLPGLLLQSAAHLSNAHPHSALLLAKAVIAPEGWAWEAPLSPEQAAGAWVMIANTHDRLGEQDDAKAATIAVLDLPGAPPERQIQAANLLVRFGEFERAFSAAMAAYEALGRPIGQTATVLYIAQRVAHWPTVAALVAQLRAAYAAGDFEATRESPRTNLLWCDDEAINIEVTRRWSEKVMPKVATARPAVAPLEGRRIRVGYLSSDFRDHPTSRLVNGLFRHHDREKFETFLYCSGWDDGSAMRREVESHMDHVHSVAKLSDRAAAKLIAGHQIDILVELNGPTRANRMGILAHRPAPVQIDYLGWPGSVGGRVVDYVVGDPETVPDAALGHYPEKVIRVSGTYQINDHRALARLSAPTRESMGLPADPDTLVLGMFNAMNKVHGEVWETWMDILKQVPKALLWILNPGALGRSHITEACRKAGVSPARVLAAPAMQHDQHLARLQCCDLMLDPWPYGGHTSTSDALFAGVPVVALEGTNFAGRVSGGLLRAAGLGDLVMPDRAAYVQKAVALLRDPARLRGLKAQMLDRVLAMPVFDAAQRSREIEAAYVQALKWAAAGEPARHITVTPPARLAARPVPAPSPAPQAGQRLPLVLVVGPWSSGTSAVAGMLAHAGLQAPGPFVQVNDPRTSQTFEMQAFRAALQGLASEPALTRHASSQEARARLAEFRDTTLRPGLTQPGLRRPILLKHALSALFLDDLAAEFDLRIVGVLRPLDQIEATRVRRSWQPHLGRAGAEVVYRALFDHLVAGQTPFELIRYGEVLAAPEATLDRLAAFSGLAPAPAARSKALAFVGRGQPVKQQAG